MSERIRTIGGYAVPTFFYGTAWKEDRTAELTLLALREGFRAIDTANQRKHYVEAGAGEGIRAAIAEGLVTREQLFLQTKFTYRRGQDSRLPYDPSASLPNQVAQSVASSLEHLGTDYLDAYVLHGPARAVGWSGSDRAVWGAMEAAVDRGAVRLLGVSNVALPQLQELCSRASIPPVFVQNRCYATTGWDHHVRAFCQSRGIAYQGFSLLTANSRELARPEVAAIASRTGATRAQVIFRFALAVGMIPLTGTSSAAHMREDLACYDVELTDEDVATLEQLSWTRR